MSHAPIALLYGSSTCYTEMSAEKIQQRLGTERVDILNIADHPIELINQYQYLILGIPTWDYGEIQEDWENIWPELDTIDFKNKHIALFGQGDQIGYPEWFLDAMGYLHDKLVAAGAIPTGYWPVSGYEFEQSQALTEDEQWFVGLALDDENQFELSEERINQWCNALVKTWFPKD